MVIESNSKASDPGTVPRLNSQQETIISECLEIHGHVHACYWRLQEGKDTFDNAVVKTIMKQDKEIVEEEKS